MAEELETASHIKVYSLDGRFTGEIIDSGLFPHQAEGIILYACGDTSGYWVTTDQGMAVNTFHVFDRQSLAHLGSFRGAQTLNTDGIALTQRGFADFPSGAFYAVHNDGNVAAFSWAAIADALGLRKDCGADRRGRRARRREAAPPLCCSLCALTLGRADPTRRTAPARPRLVVAIAVDQLRADYMDRFRPFFGRGGFNLFLQRGASFAEARYEHATTTTCPGHAVILTGSYGAVNGIIGNDWFDAKTGREVYCAADTTRQTDRRRGRRALAPEPQGRHGRRPAQDRDRREQPVVTVSAKDRSAIMLGGHLADAAYWMVDTLFVTSTYYRAATARRGPRGSTRSGKISSYFGKKWEHLLPAAAYEMVGPDDVPDRERTKRGWAAPFPTRSPAARHRRGLRGCVRPDTVQQRRRGRLRHAKR